jgi:zinc transport system substrate-binding protein
VEKLDMKRTMKRIVVFEVLALLLIVVLSAGACVEGDSGEDVVEGQPAQDTQLRVFTVNYPLAYFAKRIGGTAVDVQFPAPPDGDPAFWSPTSDVISQYQEADLILLNGAGYAKWVDRVTLPTSKLIDTSAGFKDQYAVMEDATVHTHGPEGEHAHGDVAFTTWLDLELASLQAEAILGAIRVARPDQTAQLQENFNALRADLDELNRRLTQLAETAGEMPLLGSHPVYQYLSQGYGLNIRSVHFEPDEIPSPDQQRELQQLLSDHQAKWMLWEGAPLEETVSILEGMEVGSVVFDPCGNTPETGDLLSVMRENISNLERIVGSVD